MSTLTMTENAAAGQGNRYITLQRSSHVSVRLYLVALSFPPQTSVNQKLYSLPRLLEEVCFSPPCRHKRITWVAFCAARPAGPFTSV